MQIYSMCVCVLIHMSIYFSTHNQITEEAVDLDELLLVNKNTNTEYQCEMKKGGWEIDLRAGVTKMNSAMASGSGNVSQITNPSIFLGLLH